MWHCKNKNKNLLSSPDTTVGVSANFLYVAQKLEVADTFGNYEKSVSCLVAILHKKSSLGFVAQL